jgi:hypothetical protein
MCEPKPQTGTGSVKVLKSSVFDTRSRTQSISAVLRAAMADRDGAGEEVKDEDPVRGRRSRRVSNVTS